MRAKQLRDLTDDELARKMAETRQELFNLRFQSATGALENSARLRTAKRGLRDPRTQLFGQRAIVCGPRPCIGRIEVELAVEYRCTHAVRSFPCGFMRD